MIPKFNTRFMARTLVILLISLMGSAVYAQEAESIVLDEVVAQVNNDVIMLSKLKREIREAIEQRKTAGVPESKAIQEVTNRQAELIASLIHEQLLVQRGKEMGLSDEVEAEVNKRMLEVGKEQNIPTLSALCEAMHQSGLDCDAVRASMRTEIMKGMVLNREVDAKIYYGFTTDETKKYFEQHKEIFRKSEIVDLSEIFLSLAGRPEGEVRTKAAQIVAQLRGGADFCTLAKQFSERTDANGELVAQKTCGVVGSYPVESLNEKIGGAIKNVAAGAVGDPLRTDEGYIILRVDKRVAPPATIIFNENDVREAMLRERQPKGRDEYIAKLREDAYIKLAESYRAAVEPLLKPAAKPTETGAAAQPKPDPKSKASAKKP